jgi:hypothetical protein
MMQLTETPDQEANKIQDALLNCCELDTFDLVMIYEHWTHQVGFLKKHKVALQIE